MLPTSRVRVLAGLASLSALIWAAGCSGNSSIAAPQASLQSSTVLPAGMRLVPHQTIGPGWLSAAAHGKALLFVANFNSNVVEIYRAEGTNQGPIGQITASIDGPEGMAVAAKHLYVTNTASNTVTVYRAGKTTVTKTYSQGLSGPDGVVVGTDGTVYVANLNANNVVAYAKGSMTPTSTYAGLTFPIGVTLDAQNNLYVAYGGGVEEFPSGSTTGKNLGISLAIASGIAIDKKDDIVVANQIPPGVYVFPQGATQPSKVFGQEGDPNPIAFLTNRKRLFVGEPLSNTINVYAYPSGTKVNAITNGVAFPAGVAVSPEAPF